MLALAGELTPVAVLERGDDERALQLRLFVEPAKERAGMGAAGARCWLEVRVGGVPRVSGLLGVLVSERWRGRAGTLKEESESDSARETGVGRRTVKETFSLAMAEEEAEWW